jgi:hypothetical protein
MNRLFDAFWRACAYCLHPRVILLSLLPVLLAGAGAFALAWFFWEDAVAGVRIALENSALLGPAMMWLDKVSGGSFRPVIGPLVVVALSVPVLLITALMLVATVMMPAIVSLVAQRRYPGLERRRGGSWWRGLFNALGATVLALVVLVLTLPLWLIPPLALLLPPLIWGWLTAHTFGYDALSEHASADELRTLKLQCRWHWLGMGVVTGYLGGAPSLVWVSGAMALPMMPLLLPFFVWAYTLVFAFAALWFAHYSLSALAELRLRAATATPTAGAAVIAAPAAPLPAQPGPPLLDA